MFNNHALNKFFISILLCFLAFTIFESSIFAQKYGSDVEHELHLKGGYGISYSGYGANVEWRNRRIGAGFTAGYLPKQKYEFATLSPSFQYSIFGMYYLNNNSKNWKPRIGMSIGWVNRYYDNRIGSDKYDANVYSAALTSGFQYQYKRTYFNFDLNTFYGSLKFPFFNNPYFQEKIYVSPSVGIGYQLGNLNRRMNIKVDFDQISFRNTNNKESVLNRNYNKQVKQCISSNYKIEKDAKYGICNNTVVYSHVVEHQYLFISLNLDSCKVENNCINYRFSKHNFIKAYLIEIEDLQDINCCTILEKFENIENCKRFYALDGWISIVSNQKKLKKKSKEVKIAFKIKNVRFVNSCDSENEIYFDELIVIDAMRQDLCE